VALARLSFRAFCSCLVEAKAAWDPAWARAQNSASVAVAADQAGVEVEFRAWVGVGVEEWAQVFRPGEAAVLAEGWAQAALAA